MRYDPTEEESLSLFMCLGKPDGRPAYFDLECDCVVFMQGNEIITAADIRHLQTYLRSSGFLGGKSRIDELMEQIPTNGGVH